MGTGKNNSKWQFKDQIHKTHPKVSELHLSPQSAQKFERGTHTTDVPGICTIDRSSCPLLPMCKIDRLRISSRTCGYIVVRSRSVPLCSRSLFPECSCNRFWSLLLRCRHPGSFPIYLHLGRYGSMISRYLSVETQRKVFQILFDRVYTVFLKWNFMTN